MGESQFNNGFESVGMMGNATEYQSWLLIELRRRLSPLPEPTLEQTLEEVREHLRCSRAAFEEMGFDAGESDRLAVERFGCPGEFVAGLLKAHTYASRPLSQKVLLLAAMVHVVMLGLVCWHPANPLDVLIMIAPAPFYLAACWRARAPQTKAFCGVSLGAAIAWCALLGTIQVDLGAHGGNGTVFRWATQRYGVDNLGRALDIHLALKPFDAIYSTYLYLPRLATQDRPAFVRVDGQYVAYKGKADSLPTRYETERVSSFEQAVASWKRYGADRKYALGDAAEYERQARACAEAKGDGFSSNLGVQGFVLGFGISLVLFSANLLAFVARFFLVRLRRQRPIGPLIS